LASFLGNRIVRFKRSGYKERHKSLRIQTQRFACLTLYGSLKINYSEGEYAIYDDAVYLLTYAFFEKMQDCLLFVPPDFDWSLIQFCAEEYFVGYGGRYSNPDKPELKIEDCKLNIYGCRFAPLFFKSNEYLNYSILNRKYSIVAS
jgi:hypothetical protein